jgi:7-cyano-7-deazaguanine reductase
MNTLTLTQLGLPTSLPSSPDEAQLERVPNPHSDVNYVTRFTALSSPRSVP